MIKVTSEPCPNCRRTLLAEIIGGVRCLNCGKEYKVIIMFEEMKE